MKTIQKYWPLLIIFFVSLAIYFPVFSLYFSQDDFFNMKVSQVGNLKETISYFAFQKNPHSTTFYRPLTTQVFFGIGNLLFGLNPFGYRIIVLLFFLLNLYLVYLLTRAIAKDDKIAIISLFIYGFSVSHFARIYYLSAFCEIGVAVFYFLGLLFWLKFLEKQATTSFVFTLLFFVCSLLSKETAITFPLVAQGVLIYFKKIEKTKFLTPFFIIGIVYLYLRLFIFGGVEGESYIWDFSPRLINTLAWYGVWSVGIPEMFLDFIGPKLAINPKLFLFYPIESKIILFSFVIFSLTCLFLIIKNLKNQYKSFIFYLLSFILSLAPVLFLPWHKFPLELTIPLFWFSIFLGTLLAKENYKLIGFCLTAFLFLNLSSHLLTYKTHWTIKRAEIARKVFIYLQKNYPQIPPGKSIYFYNNSAFITSGWGTSKQISVALSGSDSFQLFYKKTALKTFYEDIDGKQEFGDFIKLGTKDFLGY